MAKIEFTIVYDWLAKRPDLTWPEKIIIAHILRYAASKYGCFKSNTSIAKTLGIHRVTVIRLIDRLEYRDWIVKRTWPFRSDRSLFVNKEKLDDMPLLAGLKGCGKPVKSLTGAGSAALQGGSSAALPGSSDALQGGSSAALPGVNRNSKQCLIRNINERKERGEKTDFSSSVIIDEREKITEVQFERQRQKLLRQLQPEKQR
jgi:hypothetical protein